MVSGRWRLPGRYTVHADAAYAGLQFGPQSGNLLAIRGRGYDYSRADYLMKRSYNMFSGLSCSISSSQSMSHICASRFELAKRIKTTQKSSSWFLKIPLAS